MSGEWIKTSLSSVMDVKHGFAFPGEHIRENPPGDILLTPGNFAIGGGFKGDKYKYFDGEVPNDYLLKGGDLVLTMTDLSKKADTLGYPAIVPMSYGPRFLHNQRIGKVHIKKDGELDRGFLFYLLRTAEYRNEVLASATGTTVKHTSPSRILAYKASIPPLPEQKTIASILGSLDDKIELNRRMNATLEAMAHTMFQSWFVDFDPVRANLDGNKQIGVDQATTNLFPGTFQDSALGQIPKGWHAGTLSEAFNITMGQSPPGDTYNEIGDGLPFYQGRTDFGFRFPKRRIYCTAPNRMAKDGDTLVSVRAPVGDINMAKEECCIGRGVAAVRHNSGASSFTYLAMKNLYADFARFEAEGTVFGSINKESFGKLRFVIPPAKVIAAFEHLARPLDEEIRVLEEQSHTVANIRDSLLPKLLSGELSVRELQS